jgi:hypothetical protein
MLNMEQRCQRGRIYILDLSPRLEKYQTTRFTQLYKQTSKTNSHSTLERSPAFKHHALLSSSHHCCCFIVHSCTSRQHRQSYSREMNGHQRSHSFLERRDDELRPSPKGRRPMVLRYAIPLPHRPNHIY